MTLGVTGYTGQIERQEGHGQRRSKERVGEIVGCDRFVFWRKGGGSDKGSKKEGGAVWSINRNEWRRMNGWIEFLESGLCNRYVKRARAWQEGGRQGWYGMIWYGMCVWWIFDSCAIGE